MRISKENTKRSTVRMFGDEVEVFECSGVQRFGALNFLLFLLIDDVEDINKGQFRGFLRFNFFTKEQLFFHI